MMNLRRLASCTGLTVLFLFLFAWPANAASDLPPEPDEGFVVCAPGVEGDCLTAGPKAYLQSMAEKGISLPFARLEYTVPDPALNYLPYLYGQVVTPRAPVYGSIQDAAKSKNPIYRMDGDFLFISYEYTEVVDGVRVYMIAPGVWMNANNVHRIGTPSFQGLVFDRSPRTPFGWILTPVETRTDTNYGPGTATGNWFNRMQVVQVYEIREAGGVEWISIKPGEWIEKRYIALVRPQNAAPAEAIKDRWIDVNLYEQTIAVYENRQLVFATIISSGIDPFWTRPGLFKIETKLETTPMSGSFEADRSDYYYLEDVPWTMYFDEARAFHGAYWHTGYGYARSHGCVNMSPGDAQWLFHWAQEGDWVYVHDPSGVTPTDPSLYTSGGA